MTMMMMAPWRSSDQQRRGIVAEIEGYAWALKDTQA
jgi:hypothetical protein